MWDAKSATVFCRVSSFVAELISEDRARDRGRDGTKTAFELPIRRGLHKRLSVVILQHAPLVELWINGKVIDVLVDVLRHFGGNIGSKLCEGSCDAALIGAARAQNHCPHNHGSRSQPSCSALHR